MSAKVISFNVRIGNVDSDTVEVFHVDKNYHEVFVNDEEFSEKKLKRKQLMIVDIGCPRSLMGRDEYEKYRDSLSQSEQRSIKVSKACEKFRFGPS